ncbi:MAG: sodium:proton antiporter [Muribaculaceae bacterium]|nr:sodium:proton antiporter [Muribaculaceae bacterium]
MKQKKKPSFQLSIIPIATLLVTLASIIVLTNAEVAQRFSYLILLGAAGFTLILSKIFAPQPYNHLIKGVKQSATQILPAVPILVFIAIVSATWMLSGVVPTLIAYGIDIINPTMFLMIACGVCAVISVLSGSSWTTIATIGVAFQGIGHVMGYSEGWIAGAIISGAYFGDKVSPLSDTTVLASSACKVDLFTHIKYLMLTSAPAIILALVVYGVVGTLYDPATTVQTSDILPALNSSFNITPWVLVVPLITGVLIAMRVKTLVTLAVSSALGLAGIFVFQPQIIGALGYDMSIGNILAMSGDVVFTETAMSTGNDLLDSLVSTSGVAGMLPTIYLVLSAMLFGGVLIGTGMLESITVSFTSRLRSLRRTVGATVGCGLFLNGTTGDQYLSILLGANLFRKMYAKNGLEPRLLSRTLEDSISVTSVLIPWNSCGITQASVLGVATLTYLPYCIFNIASPLLSLFFAWTGWKIKRFHRR